MKFAAAILLLAAGVALAQMPPLPVINTNAVAHGRIVHAAPPSQTHVMVIWDADTNAWTEIDYCTNLAQPNWQFYTNVPIWVTSVEIGSTNQMMFFRAKNFYVGTNN